MPQTWQVLNLLSSQHSLHLQSLTLNTPRLPFPGCIFGLAQRSTTVLKLDQSFFRKGIWVFPNCRQQGKQEQDHFSFLPHLQLSAYRNFRKHPLRASSCEAPWAGQVGTAHMSSLWHTCWRGCCESPANTNVIAHLQKGHLTLWHFSLQFSTMPHFFSKLIWKIANSAIIQSHFLGQGSCKFSKGTTFICWLMIFPWPDELSDSCSNLILCCPDCEILSSFLKATQAAEHAGSGCFSQAEPQAYNKNYISITCRAEVCAVW